MTINIYIWRDEWQTLLQVIILIDENLELTEKKDNPISSTGKYRLHYSRYWKLKIIKSGIIELRTCCL